MSGPFDPREITERGWSLFDGPFGRTSSVGYEPEAFLYHAKGHSDGQYPPKSAHDVGGDATDSTPQTKPEHSAAPSRGGYQPVHPGGQEGGLRSGLLKN